MTGLAGSGFRDGLRATKIVEFQRVIMEDLGFPMPGSIRARVCVEPVEGCFATRGFIGLTG